MSVNIQTSSGLVKIAGTPTIDTALSNVSKNPVQNKVITEKINEINSNLSQQSIEAMDLKMLGWSVPKECPIQNYVDSDGVYHQRVGRLDLGSLKYDVQSKYNRIITTVPVDSIKSVIATNFPNAYTDYCRTETSSNAWNNNGTIDRCLTIESNTPPYVSIYSPPSDLSELKGHYLYYELAKEILIKVDGNEAVTQIKNDLSAVQSNTILNYESITVDLDSLTGHPLIASVNTGATNAPTGFGGGYMIVVYAGSSSAALYQTLVDVVNNKTYRRSLYHGSWSDWSLTAQ